MYETFVSFGAPYAELVLERFYLIGNYYQW